MNISCGFLVNIICNTEFTVFSPTSVSMLPFLVGGIIIQGLPSNTYSNSNPLPAVQGIKNHTVKYFLIFKQIFTLIQGFMQLLRTHLSIQETWFQSLGWEDPLEKEMATQSSILVWKIPWTEEPGGLQSMGLQRVRHDWAHPYYLALTKKLIRAQRFLKYW